MGKAHQSQWLQWNCPYLFYFCHSLNSWYCFMQRSFIIYHLGTYIQIIFLVQQMYKIQYVLQNDLIYSDLLVNIENLTKRQQKFISIMDPQKLEHSEETTLTETYVQDAPIGNLVYQTSTPDGRVYTTRRPVCPQRKYVLQGWIRRTSTDNIPSDIFYIGALFWTFNNLAVTGGAGWSYYYFVRKQQGNQLSSNWRYVKFDIGAGTIRPIPNNAKFASMSAVVNYTTSSATYQFCDFRVVETLS